MLRTLLSFLTVLLVSYLALVILAYLFQDRLLYFPSRQLRGTPAQRSLSFENVTLDTADGERLHGWWIPAEPERAVLLFCHGNAGNISGRLESIRRFHHLGLSVLIFDYRGYGQSTGRPSEDGLYRDVDAAWRYLTEVRGTNPTDIIAFGRSLGSGPATWLATQHRIGALILESPFTSIPDVAAVHYPWLPVRLLARSRFGNLHRIPHVEAPVLIIHSPNDEIIPYVQGRRLFEATSALKSFLKLDGGHNDGAFVTGNRYVNHIDAFVQEHLGP